MKTEFDDTVNEALSIARVMVSADLKEQFAIRFMCWCEENKGWINNYSNEEKMRIFKNEIKND